MIKERTDHLILRGVRGFHGRSWLYHVLPLHANAEPLLIGRAVEGPNRGGSFLGQPHPVAWTHSYKGKHGVSRVFFTTLGHPQEFFDESMRKLALNGFFWALGLEDHIPETGLDVDFVGEYAPNDSGFGNRFKQNMRPEEILLANP